MPKLPLAVSGLLLSLCAFVCSPPSAVLVVNSVDDEDDRRCDASHCSLREAILAANRVPRGAEIRFDLPPPHRIDVVSALPALRGRVEIDGASQAGSECPAPRVHVDGSGVLSEEPVAGLEVRGDRNRVRGLAITGFGGHGIVVRGSRNELTCLFVGVGPSGTEHLGNGGHGIAVVGGHSNRVGGPDPRDGNLLSANEGAGLVIEDALATLLGHNAIGLGLPGEPPLPNGNADLPPLSPPPPPSPLGPFAQALFRASAERRVEELREAGARALEEAGLYETYRERLGPDATGAPPPDDPAELVRALAREPELWGAFAEDAAEAAAAARAEEALGLARLRALLAPVLPDFGRDAVNPGEERRDSLGELLATLPADAYVVSGSPSDTVAVEGDPSSDVNALRWYALETWGPMGTSVADVSVDGGVTCLGTQEPCVWPLAYDLMPQASVRLFFESPILTQQEVEDILAEDGYRMVLSLNGQRLHSGPPLGMEGVSAAVREKQGYVAAGMTGPPCPAGSRCIVAALLARKILPGVPKPWTFELRVERLTELPTPIVVGVDEFGNLILASHESRLIGSASREILANATEGQRWFTESLAETFHHPRCAQCHGFEDFEGLAVHHNFVATTEQFVEFTQARLEPSLYVPGGHVMGCNDCHLLPLADPQGDPFHETEWLVPFRDLDVNWAQKDPAEICARVTTNLPSQVLRHQHLHGDARLLWAIEDGSTPNGPALEPAPPRDFAEFLRRVDLWNHFGAPCP